MITNSLSNLQFACTLSALRTLSLIAPPPLVATVINLIEIIVSGYICVLYRGEVAFVLGTVLAARLCGGCLSAFIMLGNVRLCVCECVCLELCFDAIHRYLQLWRRSISSIVSLFTRNIYLYPCSLILGFERKRLERHFLFGFVVPLSLPAPSSATRLK